ncbi:MAG: hypothetical protein K2P81_09140 [Bacteriovoracaceae bacterium]|nr:hypothetical protein [Bacteriovoracaceae bacterium]
MNTHTPPHLTKNIMEYAEVELRPAKTLLYFYFLMTLGALVTLLICPQFGVGPIGGGHGISGWVMPYGAFACGAYCGAVFVGAGTLAASAFLSMAQWRWVWRHQFLLVAPAAFIFFIVLMGIKHLGRFEGMNEGPTFYLAWNLIGVMTSWLILRTMKVVKTI